MVHHFLIFPRRSLVHSKEVQVSYFACGIIANLAMRWDSIHNTVLSFAERQQMLCELVSNLCHSFLSLFVRNDQVNLRLKYYNNFVLGESNRVMGKSE